MNLIEQAVKINIMADEAAAQARKDILHYTSTAVLEQVIDMGGSPGGVVNEDTRWAAQQVYKLRTGEWYERSR